MFDLNWVSKIKKSWRNYFVNGGDFLIMNVKGGKKRVIVVLNNVKFL